MEKKLYIKPLIVISGIELSRLMGNDISGIAPGGLAKDRDELEEELQEEASKNASNHYSLW